MTDSANFSGRFVPRGCVMHLSDSDEAPSSGAAAAEGVGEEGVCKTEGESLLSVAFHDCLVRF